MLCLPCSPTLASTLKPPTWASARRSHLEALQGGSCRSKAPSRELGPEMWQRGQASLARWGVPGQPPGASITPCRGFVVQLRNSAMSMMGAQGRHPPQFPPLMPRRPLSRVFFQSTTNSLPSLPRLARLYTHTPDLILWCLSRSCPPKKNNRHNSFPLPA